MPPRRTTTLITDIEQVRFWKTPDGETFENQSEAMQHTIKLRLLEHLHASYQGYVKGEAELIDLLAELLNDTTLLDYLQEYQRYDETELVVSLDEANPNVSSTVELEDLQRMLFEAKQKD